MHPISWTGCFDAAEKLHYLVACSSTHWRVKIVVTYRNLPFLQRLLHLKETKVDQNNSFKKCISHLKVEGIKLALYNQCYGYLLPPSLWLHCWFLNISLYLEWKYPGGYSDLSWTGCAARVSKPIPIFKGDFGQKGYPFLRIFLQKKVYFSKISWFLGFSHGENPENHVIWGSVRKADPCLRIFWVKNGTHV